MGEILRDIWPLLAAVSPLFFLLLWYTTPGASGYLGLLMPWKRADLSTPPLLWKGATLYSEAGRLRFRGLAYGSYGPDEDATCAHKPQHGSEVKLRCSCGFHAYHTRQMAEVHEQLERRSVLLEVAASGSYLLGRKGWRFGHQRVTKVLVRCCVGCTRFAPVVFGDFPGVGLGGVCRSCLPRFFRDRSDLVVTFEEAAASLSAQLVTPNAPPVFVGAATGSVGLSRAEVSKLLDPPPSTVPDPRAGRPSGSLVSWLVSGLRHLVTT